MKTPSLLFDGSLHPAPFFTALVWGSGMAGCPPTTTQPEFLRETLQRVQEAGPDFIPASRRSAVRGMLRHGKYKPAGRSKPASEYLLGAALGPEFPLVNGPVDVNNAVSLEWGYPASIFDAALSGLELLLRRGRPGESYPFNASGQAIDLEDLLCVCRREGTEWVPCGNPVKDSMATKVSTGTTEVVAVIFAPAAEAEKVLTTAAARFAELLRRSCNAADAGYSLVG